MSHSGFGCDILLMAQSQHFIRMRARLAFKRFLFYEFIALVGLLFYYADK